MKLRLMTLVMLTLFWVSTAWAGMILRRVGPTKAEKSTQTLLLRGAIHTTRQLRHWHLDGLGSPGPFYTRDSDGQRFGASRHKDITRSVAQKLAETLPGLDIVYFDNPKDIRGFTVIREGLE